MTNTPRPPRAAVTTLLAGLLVAGCGEALPPASQPATATSSSSPSAPSTVTPAATPRSTPAPPPATPRPTPALEAGQFRGTVAVRPGASVRSGPGTDMPVTGEEPYGTAEVFDAWHRRGDDPPLADFSSHALEPWSQDWFRLAGGRGWMHSAQIDSFQPSATAELARTPPPLRDVPVPPDGRRRIVISIERRHLWAFDGDRIVFDTVIGTGRPELPTLHGTFHVFYKTSRYRMVSPWPPGSPYWYASSNVEYVMEFVEGGYFIHDAPWRIRWGPGANLAAGSHGCVNVPLGVMAPLYVWTRIGGESWCSGREDVSAGEAFTGRCRPSSSS